MCIEQIFKTYIIPLSPFAAVLLAYYLGKAAFYRQKEYELIVERYLVQGLDRASCQIDKCLSIFRHNWARSLSLLRLFRDAGKDVPSELYHKGFVKPDPSIFDLSVDYRLRDLTGNDIFNHARQILEAFVQTSYDFIVHDLCTLIALYVEEGKELKVKAEPKLIFDKYTLKIKQLHEESLRFYILLGEVQNISSVIQTKRFSFKEISDLRNNEQVKKSIDKLMALFPEEKEPDLD